MFSKANKKAQVSMEYMIIIGFSLMVMIPIIILATNYSTDYSYKFKSYQAQKAADIFTKISDELFFEGYPSKRTIKIYIPDNIKDSYIINKTIVFELRQKNDIIKVYSTAEYANMSFENKIENSGYLTFELYHAINDTIVIRKK